jgi:hypothetical protein
MLLRSQISGDPPAKAPLNAPHRRPRPGANMNEGYRSQPIACTAPPSPARSTEDGGHRLVGAVHIIMAMGVVPVGMRAHHHAGTALRTSPVTVRLFLAVNLHTSTYHLLTISIQIANQILPQSPFLKPQQSVLAIVRPKRRKRHLLSALSKVRPCPCPRHPLPLRLPHASPRPKLR